MHNNTNIYLDLRNLSVILFGLRPCRNTTLNVAVGFDEYLLTTPGYLIGEPIDHGTEVIHSNFNLS